MDHTNDEHIQQKNCIDETNERKVDEVDNIFRKLNESDRTKNEENNGDIYSINQYNDH